MKKRVLYSLLTIAFIVSWFYLVDIKEAIVQIYTTDISMLVLGVMVGLVEPIIRSFRLKLLFQKVDQLFLWLSGYAGSLVSYFVPLYAGGFVFSYLVSRKMKISFKKAFLFTVADYVLGVLVTVLLGVGGLIFFVSDSSFFVNIDYVLVVSFLLLLAILLVLLKKKWMESTLKKVVEAGKYLLSRKDVLPFVAVLVFLGYLFSVLQFYLYFRAFGVHVSFFSFLFSFSVFSMMGFIPGSPFRIGQYETFGVLTLPYLLSVDVDTVFAVLLVAHVISLTVTFVLGGVSIYIVRENVSHVLKKVHKVSFF